MSIIYRCMYVLFLSTTVSDAVLPNLFLGVVAAIGAADQAVNTAKNAGIFGLPTHRQCTIQIKNHCRNHKLTIPGLYMQSGSSSVPLPHDIGPGMETVVEFIKVPDTATGAVGVFTYDLQDSRKTSSDITVALMFSVPYDFTFHKSWFAAGFFPTSQWGDYKLYRKMYYDNQYGFRRRRAEQYLAYRDEKFLVKASMTNSFTPVMIVDIFCDY